MTTTGEGIIMIVILLLLLQGMSRSPANNSNVVQECFHPGRGKGEKEEKHKSSISIRPHPLICQVVC